VRVLPALSEESKNTLLEQTDLALLPYQSVTASAVFAEWMSAGKPTLASDLPYFSTIAEKYHCLALYQRKRSGDLLAQITLLLENANRAHQLAAHAHEYARMHAWPNIAYQTAEIYAEIWRGIQAERQV
jgi:glycosyltransferase involved in cell wall biosynthesis